MSMTSLPIAVALSSNNNRNVDCYDSPHKTEVISKKEINYFKEVREEKVYNACIGQYELIQRNDVTPSWFLTVIGGVIIFVLLLAISLW